MTIARRGFLVGVVAAVVGACSGRLRQPETTSPVATMPPVEPSTAPSAGAAPTESRPASEAVAPEPEPTVAAAAPLVVPVLCRDAWGAAPARPDEHRHVPSRILVHHTAVVLEDNRGAPARWRGYQRYHQDQGWSDVAYHVGVDRSGNLYELRALDVPGDTFTDYDPTGFHLVVADGNFDEQDPTPEQVEAIARAAAAAAIRYDVPPATIDGHRDHASTSCPGHALYAALPAIRARVAEIIAAGGAETTSVCGEQGLAAVAAIESGA